jgi:hypothetical protein
MTTNGSDIPDLLRFLAAMEEEPDGHRLAHGEYFVDKVVHFRDLNREIVQPGEDDQLPEGGVGIRGDGDFWILAFLPHRFSALSCEEIARNIWPEVKDFQFLPDSGDHWWTAIHDETLEVPGEPHELWVTHVDGEGLPDGRMRFATYPSLAEAHEQAQRRHSSGHGTWSVLSWKDGVRA